MPFTGASKLLECSYNHLRRTLTSCIIRHTGHQVGGSLKYEIKILHFGTRVMCNRLAAQVLASMKITSGHPTSLPTSATVQAGTPHSPLQETAGY